MKRLALALTMAVTVACGGGGGGGTTPTQPNPPAPQQNRNPSITSMAITPTFGIQQLTQFTYQGAASDPDGDSVTYQWDVAGNPASGTSGTISFLNGGNFSVRLTVSDGRGGSATDTRTIVVGSMTGRWSGTWSSWVFTSNLTQTANIIRGDYADQLGAGGLDAAVANTIDANGAVRIRYKQGPFNDFIFTGQMDQTGRRVTGVVNGSGYTNTPFTMNKQ